MKAFGIAKQKPLLPQIFSQIDSSMKKGITVEMVAEWTGLNIKRQKSFESVRSRNFDSSGIYWSLAGKWDRCYELEDGTLAILDFKTGEASPAKQAMYRRQLMGYTLCVESPDSAPPEAVSYIGTLVFTPTDFVVQKVDGSYPGTCAFKGSLKAFQFDLDRDWFMEFMEEVMKIISMGEMPEPGNFCEVCRSMDMIARSR